MEEKILKELKAEIKKKFNKDVELSTVLNETGIDSLSLLDLVTELEDKHGIAISDDELMSIKTIEDIVKTISSKL